jgi:hypothetical protein
MVLGAGIEMIFRATFGAVAIGLVVGAALGLARGLGMSFDRAVCAVRLSLQAGFPSPGCPCRRFIVGRPDPVSLSGRVRSRISPATARVGSRQAPRDEFEHHSPSSQKTSSTRTPKARAILSARTVLGT